MEYSVSFITPILYLFHMSNTIKSRTISSIEDKRARLSNSTFARLWSSDLGTNWTTIRIGCRMSVEDSGADITGTPRFAFGICSGTSNLFLDATTTHFLGLVTYNATWARSTSPTKYRIGNGSYFDSGFGAAKRVGSTLTVDAYNSISFPGVTYAFDATASRIALFCDITKGSPNFSLTPFFYHNNGAAADVSQDTFISQIAIATPVISGYYISNQTKAVAVDEATNGYFNAINVSWDRTSPAIEISDIAVVRLA